MTTKWGDLYAARTKGMSSSAIRELLKLTQQPDIISFAGGLPAPELFPGERIAEATAKILSDPKLRDLALQYSTTEGYQPLREMVLRHFDRYGIPCSLKNVVMTAGSQQALDLIGKIMLDPGDKIIVEEPTYLGALQAWNAYQAAYITVPTDDDGMKTEELEEILKTGEGKFIYALPNFQNPTGRTMSYQRRIELIELAERYNTPIIEDDPYGQLRFEGEHETSLIVLDAQARNKAADEPFVTGNVIYLSTFSKTLCPGFRVAWMIGPEEVIARVVQAKQGSDLHTGSFSQVVAHETARGGFVDDHVRTIRKVYKERRDLMLSLLEELLPVDVQWTHPKGGLFLWITLPEGMDTTQLLDKAVEQKVAFVPGRPFYPLGGGENTMRINFSFMTPDKIEEGTKRLASVIRQEMEAMVSR